MQANNRGCGVDPAAVWWSKQPAWPAELRAQFPAREADADSALALAIVSLFSMSLIFGPLAWLHARGVRKLVAAGVLRTREADTLRAAEVVAACVTTLSVAIVVGVKIAMLSA